jgi:hypothetical protein
MIYHQIVLFNCTKTLIDDGIKIKHKTKLIIFILGT